ncbi:MAG: serine hydrolase, partial [Candidatus Eremiobacteraeota bacterium]|nr:serine hydrolase [Candidatus Eremiobacteraeota bacterium]
TVSYVVLEDGKERASLAPDAKLSVGSSFKLALLNAVVDEIRAGRRRWTDVVPLRNAWKSLPSGILQNWPEHSALTLETYATLMISQSDNTAADAIHAVVGERALGPYRDDNDPFLTTLQMFKLKSAGAEQLRAHYRAAVSSGGRRYIIDQLDKMPRPELSALQLEPALLDIEWHYSVRRLCALLERIRTLPLFEVNPGLAARAQWKSIAYKGGSDAGVLNMTTSLVSNDGRRFCISATENDPNKAIDELAFSAAYTGALLQLAR